MHSATDTYKNWKEFNDMMGGAFAGHPWHMDVPIRLIDKDHPLNKVFEGEGFTIKDEIYQFRNDTAQPKRPADAAVARPELGRDEEGEP